MKTLRNVMGYALAVAMLFGAAPVVAKNTRGAITIAGVSHKKNKGTALKKRGCGKKNAHKKQGTSNKHSSKHREQQMQGR